jgi:membrane-bound metal-dependent hydrolase YbcI (DUF457 family)
MDIEPLYNILSTFGMGVHHGIFHTYFFATIIGLAIAFILIKLRYHIDTFMSRLKLDQSKISVKWVYISSLFAAYSHIFIDSFIHSDMAPFWPFSEVNPFLGLLSDGSIYLITGAGLLLFGILYLIRLLKK